MKLTRFWLGVFDIACGDQLYLVFREVCFRVNANSFSECF